MPSARISCHQVGECLLRLVQSPTPPNSQQRPSIASRFNSSDEKSKAIDSVRTFAACANEASKLTKLSKSKSSSIASPRYWSKTVRLLELFEAERPGAERTLLLSYVDAGNKSAVLHGKTDPAYVSTADETQRRLKRLECLVRVNFCKRSDRS